MDTMIIWLKLVQKQKWVKKIRSACTLTNEGKQKIIRLPILYYPKISNALPRIVKNVGIIIVILKDTNNN